MLDKSRQGIAPGEYYHIFNRGAHRQGIFRHITDWHRLLFGVLYLQSSVPIRNIARFASKFKADFGFPIPIDTQEAVLSERVVELVSFCLMPNHFHLLVKETEEGGIGSYMQRLLGGYTKYYNTKYDASGHVFQGPYKAVHVKDDRQLTYLSAYIHKNPHDIAEWRGKEFEYPWSSLQDYTLANRWGGLIVPDIIVGQFERTKGSNYADFVRTSTAKVFAEELEGLNIPSVS